MSSPRERRGLVPIEIAMVLAIALIPWPEMMPVALPLVACASISRWLRGRSFTEVLHGGTEKALIGALAGVVGLGLALLLGTPVVEMISLRAVEWSAYPIVRGNASQMAVVIVIVTIAAIASELALRGWIVERMLEMSPGRTAVLPILVGAIGEAVVTPGGVSVRLGAALFGIGLGWMYVAAGRSVVAPMLARIAFQVGAVVLEAMRLIG
ncbi:MAG: CPBP family intramembrane metalloprotease [Deltaproteobacteria bacterium]|nr:CPBP family intramembrane metalloprotease [Deltaproteobacteria bacterium]